MSNFDWAVGITEFSTKDTYSARHTEDEDCPRCGAKQGFMCFEVEVDHNGNRTTFPAHSHMLLRGVPIKYQALSSGRSRAGC